MNLKSITGIVIRHATLSINLLFTGRLMQKPLTPNIAELCLYCSIAEEKLANRSNYILRNVWKRALLRLYRKLF